MSKIIGVTVGTPISPASLERKLKPVKSINGIEADENGNVEIDVKDGYTPVKGVDYFDGEDGYTPVKGEDYYTEADKDEMVAAVLAAQPKMELIDTITIEEENIGNIVRDGFMLDAVTLVVNCPAAATTGKLQPRYHYPTASGSNWATMVNITVTNASNTYQTHIDFYKRFGWWCFEWLASVPYWSGAFNTQPQYTLLHNEDGFPYVNKITLITTDLPVGTTIKIYGVRRNEN